MRRKEEDYGGSAPRCSDSPELMPRARSCLRPPREREAGSEAKTLARMQARSVAKQRALRARPLARRHAESMCASGSRAQGSAYCGRWMSPCGPGGGACSCQRRMDELARGQSSRLVRARAGKGGSATACRGRGLERRPGPAASSCTRTSRTAVETAVKPHFSPGVAIRWERAGRLGVGRHEDDLRLRSLVS